MRKWNFWTKSFESGDILLLENCQKVYNYIEIRIKTCQSELFTNVFFLLFLFNQSKFAIWLKEMARIVACTEWKYSHGWIVTDKCQAKYSRRTSCKRITHVFRISTRLFYIDAPSWSFVSSNCSIRFWTTFCPRGLMANIWTR